MEEDSSDEEVEPLVVDFNEIKIDIFIRFKLDQVSESDASHMLLLNNIGQYNFLELMKMI